MQLKNAPSKWHSVQEIADVQQELLRAHLDYCQRNSPFYRTLFAPITPHEVTLESLAQLPFTDKDQFAKCNADFLAVTPDNIVDIVLSSGTTGAPTRVMYTERDLQRLAYNEAASFAGCGVTRRDVALLTCTLDRCFVAGLAYQTGLRQLGAAVIRNGASTLQSHCELIARLKPTLIVGVPTFLRKLGRHMRETGVEPAMASVRKLVCIGEPLRDADLSPLPLGSDLENLWNAETYSTYASSEICASFCECSARRGGHLHPELAIVEIIDEAGMRLPPGQHGEVVFTPLQVEGMPLVRFKTGDVSFLISEPCACGRITPRLGPILGRKSQMIKIKGTTVYPLAIVAVLTAIPGISEYCIEVTSDDCLCDQVAIHVALSGHDCSAETISERLQASLRVKIDVIIESEAALAQRVFGTGTRKAVRFMDERSHNS